MGTLSTPLLSPEQKGASRVVARYRSRQVDGPLGSVGPGAVKPISGVESMRAAQIRLVVSDDPKFLACTGPRAMPVRMPVVNRADMSVLMVHAPYLVLFLIERPALVARLRPTPAGLWVLTFTQRTWTDANPDSPY